MSLADIKIVSDGITFDDVLLIPARSDFIPNEANTQTRLTRNININIPIVSAAMDTVTESALAVAIAQEGGIGMIHKNLSIDMQVIEVKKVKRSENGIILDPFTLSPDDSVITAKNLMKRQRLSGIPIIIGDKKLVGILTKRDLKFLTDLNIKVGEVMTKGKLVTGPADTTLEQAKEILRKHKVEKLLLVNGDKLAGMITMRDIDRVQQSPFAAKDSKGRLLVGAAVGVNNYERVEELIKAEVDVVVVDTAHGHSQNVIETVKNIKKKHSIDVIAGNIATAEAAKALIKAGADAVKVGIGPGAICTTRVISGVGVPQISAIMNVTEEANKHNVPVIADGGIKLSGEIAKAIAAGASSVMLGSMLAGLYESPGQLIIYRGRQFKEYRGMGSLGAMIKGSADRYSQGDVSDDKKLVPEGVEGRVPYRGKLNEYVYQLVGGLRAGMGYCGTPTIEELRNDSRFVKVTAASIRESHPHNITITKESPNYSDPISQHQ